jgi:hypothetical protein
VRRVSAEAIVSAVFVGGVGVLSFGVGLIYTPAGLIVAGGAAAAGAFLHERGRQ